MTNEQIKALIMRSKGGQTHFTSHELSQVKNWLNDAIPWFEDEEATIAKDIKECFPQQYDEFIKEEYGPHQPII